jgi:hypothetical protein
MSKRETYDLSYRPASYWGPQDLKTYYGAQIKGELRRVTAMSQLDEGDADNGVLQSALSEEERAAVGAFHPWFMGGEYLPDLMPNEVEIARVTLKSTLMDVFSIRARRLKSRIAYRIVDEYMEDGDDRFAVKPKTSLRPITMGQVIQMIQDNDLVDGFRNMNYEDMSRDPEEVYDFATVSSAFYPELSDWFDQANEEWLEAERAKLEED